jgi:16S rRNA (uracil1498-N3)-methyltransferase
MRRVHVARLLPGPQALDAAQAHHLRHVLRLRPGDEVEAFDDEGRTAVASLAESGGGLVIEPGQIREPRPAAIEWTIASAIPKGSRADWMVEKLSELGATRFIPLAAGRSVVLPQGTGKRGRWQRIAEESARQSRREGVMHIDELADARALAEQAGPDGWYLCTSPAARPAHEAVRRYVEQTRPPRRLVLMIGPEGGWTDAELAAFEAAGLTGIGLGTTILRIETAAVAAAAIVCGILRPQLEA